MLTKIKLIVKIPSFPIRILLNRSGPISCPDLKNSPSIIQYLTLDWSDNASKITHFPLDTKAVITHLQSGCVMILTGVDRIAIGLGTQGNVTIPGGSGKMFFDDLRLYRPRETAE